MSGGFDSTIPITRPVLTKEYYDRLTPQQKARAAESHFLSIYLNQIYSSQNHFEDEELDDETSEKFMDTSTQFDLVQQQYSQVLADQMAKRGVLGFERLVDRQIKGNSTEKE